MKKICLSMFYSIQVGEEPNTDQPPLLAPKILSFPKKLEFHLFSFSIQMFLCVVFSRLFETPKNGQIPFLKKTYKMRHYKKDNGNPAIN
jgi:hypothetical protein